MSKIIVEGKIEIEVLCSECGCRLSAVFRAPTNFSGPTLEVSPCKNCPDEGEGKT